MDRLNEHCRSTKRYNPDSTLEAELPSEKYSSKDSPIGLYLPTTESLLDMLNMIQMSLDSQEHASKLPTPSNNHHSKSIVSNTTKKSKATNWSASVLKIGTWEYKAENKIDLVAKCYFGQQKLVWEVIVGDLKKKIEINWSDIVDLSLKASSSDDGLETLYIVLDKKPRFFMEYDPQPKELTKWQWTTDFTKSDIQASTNRQHFLLCKQGVLRKHFEQLIQCDSRLNHLSKQPDMLLESPYFESEVPAVNDPYRFSCGFDLPRNKGSDFYSSYNVASSSGTQSFSSNSEAQDNITQRNPSPYSVMHTPASEDIRGSGFEEPNLLRPHIGYCFSENMASRDPIFNIDNEGTYLDWLDTILDSQKGNNLEPQCDDIDVQNNVQASTMQIDSTEDPIFYIDNEGTDLDWLDTLLDSQRGNNLEPQGDDVHVQSNVQASTMQIDSTEDLIFYIDNEGTDLDWLDTLLDSQRGNNLEPQGDDVHVQSNVQASTMQIDSTEDPIFYIDNEGTDLDWLDTLLDSQRGNNLEPQGDDVHVQSNVQASTMQIDSTEDIEDFPLDDHLSEDFHLPMTPSFENFLLLNLPPMA